MDWKKHWQENPIKFGETEFFKQIENTVGGQPITKEIFDASISDIIKALCISDEDRLLDLGCGNGIRTLEISKKCKFVVGVDYSEPLIKIAKKYNNPSNISYYCLSILDKNIIKLSDELFTKVIMYGVLQHINGEDLLELLTLLKVITTKDSIIFVGSIPDKNKLWDFYDTEERKKEYRQRVEDKQEAIGTWWTQEQFSELCSRNGYICEIIPQNRLLDTAHYRFDARLTKQDSHVQ